MEVDFWLRSKQEKGEGGRDTAGERYACKKRNTRTITKLFFYGDTTVGSGNGEKKRQGNRPLILFLVFAMARKSPYPYYPLCIEWGLHVTVKGA